MGSLGSVGHARIVHVSRFLPRLRCANHNPVTGHSLKQQRIQPSGASGAAAPRHRELSETLGAALPRS
jgi:hypothetical protein